MPQIFHPSFNTISRVSIFGALFFVAAAVMAGYQFVRSPYVTEVGVVREQPVPFSHRHHVGDVGIDCRYCHTTVEDGAVAGVPPTQTCMNCHSQLWKDSPLLAPVRESYESGEPLQWTRVHDLPDFAYFNHSIHVKKGIGCKSCHGEVNNMPLMWREHSLQMRWCLDCHRNPEQHIRPPHEVFNMEWDADNPETFSRPPAAAFSDDWNPQDESEYDPQELIEALNVKTKTNCSVCHR